MDIDFILGDVEDDAFFFVEHTKEVDDVGVAVFVDYISVGVEMDEALVSSWHIDSDHDKSVIVGGREAEDLACGFFEFDRCGGLK